MKVLILVALPGAGKTTLALELLKEDPNLVHVCQDLLGSRYACIKLMHKSLSEGKSVIVDRTNINKQQRKYFIDVAKQYETSVQCIELCVSFDECVKRVDNRDNHPTVDKDLSLDEKTKIVNFFHSSYEEPTISEGFDSINVRYHHSSEDNQSSNN